MSEENTDGSPKKKLMFVRSTPFENARLGSRKVEEDSATLRRLKAGRRTPKDKSKQLKEIASKTANLWQKARQGYSLGKFSKLNKTINKRRYGIDIEDKGLFVEKGTYIIHPNNIIYVGFTYILAMVILYAATFLPYQLAFHGDKDHFWTVTLVRALYAFDMVISFFVAYFDERLLLVINKKKIARNYLKSWFFLDLFTIVPFEFFVITNGTLSELNRRNMISLIVTLKLVKALWNRSLKNIISALSMYIRINIVFQRLILFMLVLIILCHLTSCLYYLVISFAVNQGDEPLLASSSSTQTASDTELDIYLKAFLWTFQTATTAGFGSSEMRTSTERIFAMIWMCFGVAFTTFLAGNIQQRAMESLSQNDTLRLKLATLQEFSSYVDLSDPLKYRVGKYFELSHQEMRNLTLLKNQNLLDELPFPIKAPLVFFIIANLIERLPRCISKDPIIVAKLAKHLRAYSITTGEMLYGHGDYAEEIFILISGTLVQLSDSGAIVSVFTKGDVVGLHDMLERKKFRRGSAKAKEECTVFGLHFHIVNELCRAHPNFLEKLRKLNANYMNQTNTHFGTTIAEYFINTKNVLSYGPKREKLWDISYKTWKNAYMVEDNFKLKYIREAHRKRLQESNKFRLIFLMKRAQKLLRNKFLIGLPALKKKSAGKTPLPPPRQPLKRLASKAETIASLQKFSDLLEPQYVTAKRINLRLEIVREKTNHTISLFSDLRKKQNEVAMRLKKISQPPKLPLISNFLT